MDTEENCQFLGRWCTLAINHGTSTEAVNHENAQKVALTLGGHRKRHLHPPSRRDRHEEYLHGETVPE